MKHQQLTVPLFAYLLILVSSSFGIGQIVYKIPDGGFPMDWNKSGFKGMLFLQKDSPSGIFIAFPNANETSDDLRDRAAKFIAPMVVEGTREMTKIPFEMKTIKAHKDDIQDRAKYYFFKGEKSQIQILFFERQTPNAVVLYGYFAQKNNDDTKSNIWVGDDLKDPKILAKFVSSFKVKSISVGQN